MGRYAASRDPVPRDVARRFDVDVTTTSAFARSLMLRLEGQRAECFRDD
jgi:hypothetical protein